MPNNQNSVQHWLFRSINLWKLDPIAELNVLFDIKIKEIFFLVHSCSFFVFGDAYFWENDEA